MKQQTYNSQELALISVSYLSGLFPKPKAGELIVDDSAGNGTCDFVYEESYYERYLRAFMDEYFAGGFAKSNSDDQWMVVLNKLRGAKEVIHVDKTKYHDYWLIAQ